MKMDAKKIIKKSVPMFVVLSFLASNLLINVVSPAFVSAHHREDHDGGPENASPTVLATSTSDPTAIPTVTANPTATATSTPIVEPTLVPTSSPNGNGNGANKIRICHSTDSHSNPYTSPEVDQDAVDGNLGNDNGQGDHYMEHNGPVWYSGIPDHSWGDIVPPIAGVHEGKNWNSQGQAFWNNNCNIPVAATPTATPTSEPTPTPSGDVLSCSNVSIFPSLGEGNKFEFGQTYTLTANATGATGYTWSINPPAPALSSTTGNPVTWTAPSVANPSVTWVATATVTDGTQNVECSIQMVDPASTTPVPTPTLSPAGATLSTDTGIGGGQVLGAQVTSGGSTGKVLGATTMANAGSGDDLMSLVFAFGAIASGFGVRKYAYAKKIS